ncbi:MAG: 30S ribosomal protein S1 [Armatimonadetes bacterium]|nr:30S ribosomal protein S1 [Armatimonadota bacterium]
MSDDLEPQETTDVEATTVSEETISVEPELNVETGEPAAEPQEGPSEEPLGEVEQVAEPGGVSGEPLGDVERVAEATGVSEEPSGSVEQVAEAEATPVAPARKKSERTQKPRSESDMDYSNTFRELTEGDVVPGVVVHIDKEGVLVDVGTKSEGIIRPHELATSPYQSAEDVVSVGEEINVYVMETENQDGNLILSKKRADFEKAWDKVQAAMEDKRVITAMVNDRVKGGLVVDLGIRGFVPASHVGSGKVKNLEKYIGQSLPLKVIEVDRERRKVVLSHRLATEEEREKKREETVAALTEGQVRDGVVRRITDYGAFVDLGGIDGLLHISEMSWTRINHPSEVVKVGQKIQVAILKLNLEQGRVSLGMRQILPDPWTVVPGRYTVGETIEVTISRLVPFGAFVALEGGIEAIIPNSELSRRRVNRPEDIVSVGETVQAKVIDIKPEERRMTLSIRQIREDKEREEYDSYRHSSRSSSQDSGRMTLGDLVGSQLKELQAGMKQETPAEEPVAEAISDSDAAQDVSSVEDVVENVVEPEAVVAEPEPEAVEESPEEVAEATSEEAVIEGLPETETDEGEAEA